MISREALGRIIAVIVLLALAPTLVVFYTHIDSNIGLQSYRNWTADDPLPTPNTINNYTLIPIALNTTAFDFNVSNASYVYYIKVYNGSTVTNYVVLHWDQFDFVNNTVITDVLIPSFYDGNGTAITPGYISVSSATVPGVGINNGQVFIKKSKWAGYVNDYRYYITVTSYDIYAVYPKVSGNSNTSIVGALLPVFLLAIAVAVLSKLGL